MAFGLQGGEVGCFAWKMAEPDPAQQERLATMGLDLLWQSEKHGVDKDGVGSCPAGGGVYSYDDQFNFYFEANKSV